MRKGIRILSAIMACLFILIIVGGCQAGDNSANSWKSEYKSLQQWRDKNNLPFSNKKLEDIARHYPRIDKWVEIQEHKYGISGVLSALNPKPKERKVKIENLDKSNTNIINSGQGADPEAW